jgi:superoxide dismutase, Fe-Mn family
MSSRRDVIKTLGVGALSLAAASTSSVLHAQQQPELANIVHAFAANMAIKPLGFAPDQLDGISENVIVSHWENNYAGSVRALNTIKQRLESALADDALPAFIYNDLKREHLMRTGSVILHELYFDNMVPPSGRNAELDRGLAAAFGSVDNWEKEFRRIASGLGGGSGWVMLAWNHHLGTLENYWMADHLHCPVHVSPILVLDMYEHSYHMDFGAAAGEYISAFMRNVHWEMLAQRLDAARRQA